MTAHSRTAGLTPRIAPAIGLRSSTHRVVVVTVSFLLHAVIVLGFVSSSLGLGAAPHPASEYGLASPAPSVTPVAPAIEAAPATSGASGPQPAPAPAP